MIEKLSPQFTYIDERGSLIQLVCGGYTDVNLIFTRAGSTRGRFHYHHENYEAFYIISGSFVLNTRDEQLIFNAGDMLRIPPNMGHSLEFQEDTLMISMYSVGIDLPNGTRDIVEVGS